MTALPPCACGHLQCLHIPAAASAGRCTGAGCDCRGYVRRTTLPDEHLTGTPAPWRRTVDAHGFTRMRDERDQARAALARVEAFADLCTDITAREIRAAIAGDTPPAAGYGADMGTNGPAAALQRILTDHDVHDLDAHDVIAALAAAGLTITPAPGDHIDGTIPGVTGYTIAELRAVWQSMLDGSVHPLREKRLACMAVGLVNQMQPLRDALADQQQHLPLPEVLEIAADLARRAATPPDMGAPDAWRCLRPDHDHTLAHALECRRAHG